MHFFLILCSNQRDWTATIGNRHLSCASMLYEYESLRQLTQSREKCQWKHILSMGESGKDKVRFESGCLYRKNPHSFTTHLHRLHLHISMLYHTMFSTFHLFHIITDTTSSQLLINASLTSSRSSSYIHDHRMLSSLSYSGHQQS
jgi:hypothetical protein